MSWVGVAGWITALGSGLGGLALWRLGAARAEHVARVSHELRGPIGAVRLGVDLARRGGRLSPERLRALDLELGRATQALDDLLTVSRRPGCRSGPARAGGEAVEITALVADSVEAWRPVAGERELRLELRRGAGVLVAGQRLRLAQATGNLIANAIEHGDGPIVVWIRTGVGVVRVEVQDAGKGLAKPLAELVHPRRLGLRARRHGHGLRVAAAVARAHGGKLLSAPAERGARLVLELPLATAEVRPVAQAKTAARP